MEKIKNLLASPNSKNSLEDTISLIRNDKCKQFYFNISCIQQDLRRQIIEWMIIVNNKLNFSSNCFHIQIEIFDSFCDSKEFKLETLDIHLLAVTAINLSAKFEEIKILTLNTIIQNVCHNKYTKEEILKFEIVLLKTLKYRIKSNYFCDFAIIFSELFSIEKTRKQYYDIFVFNYQKAIIDYRFYRKYSKLQLYLAVVYVSLLKINIGNQVKFSEILFLVVVESIGCNIKNVMMIAKKLAILCI